MPKFIEINRIKAVFLPKKYRVKYWFNDALGYQYYLGEMIVNHNAKMIKRYKGVAQYGFARDFKTLTSSPWFTPVNNSWSYRAEVKCFYTGDCVKNA